MRALIHNPAPWSLSSDPASRLPQRPSKPEGDPIEERPGKKPVTECWEMELVQEDPFTQRPSTHLADPKYSVVSAPWLLTCSPNEEFRTSPVLQPCETGGADPSSALGVV